MSGTMRAVLEVGSKGRRVVAAALDWPGLDRWGATDDEALQKLETYVARYAGVAERAGKSREFAGQQSIDVVERYAGSSSTDFWGIAHVPSQIERAALSPADLQRRLELLSACWAYFDEVASRVSEELRPGPRGGGWTRDEIIRHVHINEPEQMSRKVEVRTPPDAILTPDGRARHRAAYLHAIREYNDAGRMAGRSWTVPFLIRRTAHHVMDHAWELEDRDLTPALTA